MGQQKLEERAKQDTDHGRAQSREKENAWIGENKIDCDFISEEGGGSSQYGIQSEQ
jgi:hypothetical protein